MIAERIGVVKMGDKEQKEPKTVELEDLVVGVILNFCENAAELGCPKDKEVDMWFRYLEPKEMRKVADHLLEIVERDAKGLC
jgi:hypothetical protein